MLRRTASRARFRDVSVRTIEGDASKMFDSVAVSPRAVPTNACFLVRDVAARSGFAEIGGTAKDLTLVSSRTERAGAQFFEAILTKQKRGDRAVTLVYALPLPEGELERPPTACPLWELPFETTWMDTRFELIVSPFMVALASGSWKVPEERGIST